MTAEQLNEPMNNDICEKLAGPLAELIVAYQDAESPAIQDTLRRGRAALDIYVRSKRK